MCTGRLIRIASALAIACGAGFPAAAQAPDLDKMDVVLKSVPDGPVAKVNGRLVERDDFVRLYQAELLGLMRDNQMPDAPDTLRAQLGLRCVGLLIERELLYDEARKRKITVPADHIEKAWLAQVAQTQKVVKERENKDLTEADVLRRLGFSKREEVFASLERALVTEKMRATVVRESDLKITDEEVKKEFDEDKADYSVPARLHLQQIFINPDKIPGTRAEKESKARERATQAFDRLTTGQSFEGVARAMSDAPDAQSGGDMTMQAVNNLPSFMVNAAANLKPGGISDVIQSEFGFHIFKLVAFEAPQEASLAGNERAVRNQILAQRAAEVVHDYCDKLVKEGAEVQVYLELEKNLVLNGALAEAKP